MRDFTRTQYRALLQAIQKAGYSAITFGEYCKKGSKSSRSSKSSRFVILRHDVDLKAGNSLCTAQIEAELGMKSSYYFRVVPESNQPEIIRQIAALGHEIGYHYEDMSIANGDVAHAIKHFEEWLEYFRQFYPVETVCMHGAPTSQYDGRDLWKEKDYHDYGIIGEPYFDADFAHMLYLTDTGRCWDGYKVSVRDKIPVHQDEWTKQGLVFHHTSDIIRFLSETPAEQLPNIMFTTHPQRWTDSKMAWLKELILQNIKNIIKRVIVTLKNSK